MSFYSKLTSKPGMNFYRPFNRFSVNEIIFRLSNKTVNTNFDNHLKDGIEIFYLANTPTIYLCSNNDNFYTTFYIAFIDIFMKKEMYRN